MVAIAKESLESLVGFRDSFAGNIHKKLHAYNTSHASNILNALSSI